MKKTRLKLYSGSRNASSWALRAWLALREAGLEFEEEIIDIRRPQRFAGLARMAALGPSATVPLLETPEGVIFDSLAIMEYANDRCGGRLLPEDAGVRGQARSLVAWQHAGLSGICARIPFESAFYPVKRALDAREQAEARRLFGFLEETLERSGGPYLFADLTLADLVLTPAVVRLCRHDVALDGLPRVQAWTQNLLAHRALGEWLADADAETPIWFDDYLEDCPAPVWR